MALWMAMLVDRTVHFGSEWHISNKYWMDYHEIWHKYPWCPEDESDQLWWSPDFSSEGPPEDQTWHSEISQHLIRWNSTDVHGSQIMNNNDFGDPLTFPLVLPAVWHFWFSVKYLNNYCCCYRWLWLLNTVIAAEMKDYLSLVILTLHCRNSRFLTIP